MKIDEQKKKKLKEIFELISNTQDKNEDLALNKINKLQTALQEVANSFETTSTQSRQEIENLKKKIKPVDWIPVLEVLEEIKKGVFNIKLQEKIDKDYSPAYKMMIDKLSGVEQGVRGWKFPQYAYTGLRNKDFSPINPATDKNATLTIYSVSMATAGVEYSQLLPDNTITLDIKLRDLGNNLTYSWISGGNYMTIPAGGSRHIDGILFNTKTIYLKSDGDGQTAEIECFITS